MLQTNLLELRSQDSVVLDGQPVSVFLHVDHLVLGSLVTGHKHNLECLASRGQVSIELRQHWCEQSTELL